jgi:hypothetical protein
MRAPAAPTMCPSGHTPFGSTTTDMPQSRQWTRDTLGLLAVGIGSCRQEAPGAGVASPRRRASIRDIGSKPRTVEPRAGSGDRSVDPSVVDPEPRL